LYGPPTGCQTAPSNDCRQFAEATWALKRKNSAHHSSLPKSRQPPAAGHFDRATYDALPGACRALGAAKPEYTCSSSKSNRRPAGTGPPVETPNRQPAQPENLAYFRHVEPTIVRNSKTIRPSVSHPTPFRNQL
jgi:hypothetical protein